MQRSVAPREEGSAIGLQDADSQEGVFPPDLHDTHHLWLKAVLLAVWVVASFGVCFYARELQSLVAGWQLGYWMAAQGAVLIFLLIVLVYSGAMRRFERLDAQQRAAAAYATGPESR